MDLENKSCCWSVTLSSMFSLLKNRVNGFVRCIALFEKLKKKVLRFVL